MLASGTSLTGGLGDAVFLAITVAFFGLAWLLVRACERIGGTEEVLDAGADLGVPIGAEVSTGGGAAQDTGGRRDPSGERTGRTGVVAATALVGGTAMTVDNVVGLVLALALVAYLVAALVVPERF